MVEVNTRQAESMEPFNDGDDVSKETAKLKEMKCCIKLR
jgi:hypothetical protein